MQHDPGQHGRFPGRTATAAGAGQLGPGSVAGVVVEDGERLAGDLLRRPPGVRLVGEDAHHGAAGLVAIQHVSFGLLARVLRIRASTISSLARLLRLGIQHPSSELGQSSGMTRV